MPRNLSALSGCKAANDDLDAFLFENIFLIRLSTGISFLES